MAGTRPRETRGAVIDAVGRLLPSLLTCLDGILWVQRNLYPPIVARLADRIAPQADALAESVAVFEGVACPDDMRFMRDRLVDVATDTVELVRRFAEAARSSADFVEVFRAVRRLPRVQESLYPLAP